MLFDSHCHFTDSGFDESRNALAEEIRAAGMLITDIGCDLESSKVAAAAAKEYDFCYAAAGFHPSEVDGLTEEVLSECLDLCELPKVVAIGEIGLDFHWDDAPAKEVQRHWFIRQLEEAVKREMPVCIHTRDADGETYDILKREIFDKTDRVKVLLHCYSGSAELARQYVKLGAKISIAGPVTYKNARKTVETVEALDLKDLLIETDSPYLAPVPMRGKQNLPLYVEYTARKIAEIKGVSFEEVAEASFKKACEFYGIKR